jgi:hypothetical protein
MLPVVESAHATSRRLYWTPLIVAISGVFLAPTALPSSGVGSACPGGRYVVRSGAQVLVGGGAPDPVVVTLERGKVGLGQLCPLRRGVVTRTSRQTEIAVHWARCGRLRGVRLRAHFEGDDTTMTGAIGVRGAPGRQFMATCSSCGDGIVDVGAGEVCDGAIGCGASEVCARTCGSCATASFVRDVQPIFTSRCALPSCHAYSPDIDFTLVLDLRPAAAYADVVNVPSKQCAGEPRVTPGAPDLSYLLRKVEGLQQDSSGCGDGARMPPPPIPPLSSAQIAALRSWILDGALNN